MNLKSSFNFNSSTVSIILVSAGIFCLIIHGIYVATNENSNIPLLLILGIFFLVTGLFAIFSIWRIKNKN